MFFREKKTGARTYLQLVENKWADGKTRQRVVATIGRMDKLAEDGQLEALIRSAVLFDGKRVLRTSLDDMPSEEVALKYKQLLTVESLFRSAKSLLETRPIHHKRDETIRGHVFCSFLALILMKDLEDRLESKGYRLEWKDVIRDLDQLEEVTIEQDKKRFLLRTQCKGVCGKVFQAVGVALPPTLRQLVP